MFHKYKMITITRVLLCSFILIFSTHCTQKKPSGSDDPKKRLTEYISKSFSISNIKDREALASYLTGNAKQRLAAWSDDQFRQAFIDSKRQFVKLVFREVKNISPTSVHITYELTYTDQSKGGGTKITNKKLCHLISDHGPWLITEVQNIKELVEYSNELALP